jgi:hypothetical protein
VSRLISSRADRTIGWGYPRDDVLPAHVGEHQRDLHSQGTTAGAQRQHERVFVARTDALGSAVRAVGLRQFLDAGDWL